MVNFFKPQKAKPSKAPATLHIERQSHDGRGVAIHAGKTVFVSGALPGETVSVSHFLAKAKRAECRARDILHASPDRIAPVCQHFGECGGCSLQYQTAEDQLSFKQASVRQQLARLGHVLPENITAPITSPSFNYRNRARLAINRRGELCFRGRHDADFIAIKQCHVLAADLQVLVEKLLPIASFAPHKITHIEMITAGGSVGAVLRHTAELSTALKQWLGEVETSLGATFWLQPQRHGELYSLLGEAVDPRIHYSLNDFGVKLAFHPGDFTQVNHRVNQQMVAQALEWLQLDGADRVVDLFCGIGNFTLPMARTCEYVYGVEVAEHMVARGRENAASNRITNCEFLAADLESVDLLEQWRAAGVSKVLLDPPRAGAKSAVELLLTLSPERVVYVSCNPASLARDAQILVEGGYRLERLSILDMFPQTAHVESMALFVR